MPLVTRVFVRTALLYLIAALVIGLLIVGQTPLRLPIWMSVLTPIYFHLLMVGWVTQLIIGIAYWMFPKFRKDRPRGSDRLAWSCYILLNSGLLLRLIVEPQQALRSGVLLGWLLVAAAILQWFGGVAFVLTIGPRVKER